MGANEFYLRVYRETLQPFAGKESVCKVCVLRQSVHHLQCCYLLILTVTSVRNIFL
jgi:hypothetical protein